MKEKLAFDFVQVGCSRWKTRLVECLPTLFLLRWGWFIVATMLVTTVSTAFFPDIPTPTRYQASLLVQSPLPAHFGITRTQDTSNIFYTNFFVSPAVLNMVLPKHKDLQLSDLQLYVTALPVVGTNVIQLSALGPTPQEATSLVEDVYDAAVIEPGIRRSGLINALTNLLNAELIQARNDVTSTFATLQTLKAQKLMSSPAYFQLYASYREQQQLVDNINKHLSVLQQQGSIGTDILKLGSSTPSITTIPGYPPTRNLRLSLSPLIGLIMGLGGALLASTFTDQLPLRSKKHRDVLPHCIATIPWLAGLQQNVLQTLKQNPPCLWLLQQLRNQASADKRPLRLITVTSPDNGEGKSTIATSLALAASQCGLKTMLVDAHLQQPILHSWFQLSATPGMLDAVSRCVTDPTRAAVSLDLTEHNPGIMPIGDTSLVGQTQTERFPIKGLRSFMEVLRFQADIVIIDAPALLHGGNALHLASLSDMTLLVVDAYKSRGHRVGEAEKLLLTIEASFAAILNRARAGEEDEEDTEQAPCASSGSDHYM
ncbi:MAG TPA: CpsD/CapB family tyrosine-protein kinase [Ktedonobacteraceae bacterium]|nr:CpsD/CapB family tyrosine-protein kinase [Ktedonobacteraceae bacterium]